MKRSTPLERISEALGGEQGLRQVRNSFGIPSFCYKSRIGWIDIITEGNRISHASFSEVASLSVPTVPPTLPVLTRTIKLLDIYFAGDPIDFAEIPMQLAYATEFQQQVWAGHSANSLWRGTVVSMDRRSDRAAEIGAFHWKRSRCKSGIDSHSVPSCH